MNNMMTATHTFFESAKRFGDWCVRGQYAVAINPTPAEALV